MSKRIQRVNELIKRELSQILLRDVEFPRDILVTVTRVETSPDLRESRVYVSTMPAIKSREILKVLNQLIYGIQQEINKRLKMKPIPKIIFIREEKVKEAARIEEILEKLKKGEK